MSVGLMAAIGIPVATIVTGILTWLGVRHSNRIAAEQNAAASLEKATAAWEGLYDKQEVRLSALEARTSRLEQANDSLAAENRVFREVVAGIIARLRREPPEDAGSVVAYILDHLPIFRKDTSSDEYLD